MAAPLNNQFWKARATCGRDKLFSSPDTLWDAACEYFQWCHDNPLYEDKVAFFQGVPTHEPVEKLRAMTIAVLSTPLAAAKNGAHTPSTRDNGRFSITMSSDIQEGIVSTKSVLVRRLSDIIKCECVENTRQFPGVQFVAERFE